MGLGDNGGDNLVGLDPLQFASPAPVGTAVGLAEVQGTNLVVLRVESVNGSQIYFLDPRQAQDIGKHLQKAGKEAALGITIAKDLPPK